MFGAKKFGLGGEPVQEWMPYSLTAIFLWGIWGFLSKLASRSLPAPAVLFVGTLGGLLTVVAFVLWDRDSLRIALLHKDTMYAMLGGIVGTVGGLLFYVALGKGEASRVVPMSAVYPLVTVLLGCVFLREPLSLKKIIGIACATAGVYLVSR
ncbi:MAG: EamA family transporter [Kiritimatiellia bacterium]